MKIQKLLNMQILGSFFLLMINVSAGYVELQLPSYSKSSDCQEICKIADQCHHYTYCNGVCYLKRSTGWISTSNDGCTSGNYQGTLVRKNTDYLYSDIKWEHQNSGLKTSNAEECQKICKVMNYCYYYTYCNSGYCYFKNKHGWTRKYKSSCTTGDYQGTYKLKGVDYSGGDTN